MSVPTFGGIPLVDDGASTQAGAAFVLRQHAPTDRHVAVDGWTVEVRAKERVVVAKGRGPVGYPGALSGASVAVQKGLDLLAIHGSTDLDVSEAGDEHVVWWPSPEGLVVRVVALSQSKFDAHLTLTVTDATGRVKESAPPEPPRWHECYRYFRLSQTTDDLFDSYRNAFLALESLLSDVAPPRPGEGDGDWFGRALGVAGRLIDLASLCPEETSEPVAYLKRQLYSRIRTALFHAKSNRPVLQPRSEAERRRVGDGLKVLVRLFLLLAETTFGVRRGSASLSTHGFEVMATTVLDGIEVYVTDDERPFGPVEQDVAPAGANMGRLPEMSALDLSTPFLASRVASGAVSDLAHLPFVGRIVTTNASGVVLLGNVLPARLVPHGAARLEATVNISIVSARGPRTRFLT